MPITRKQAQRIVGYIDMRLIRKNNRIIADNSGETMVEVIVAFALLSIMLLLFSQGIAGATRSEYYAVKSRTSADIAMRALHEYKATNNIDSSNYSCPVTVDVEEKQLDGGWLKYEYAVTVDGDTYVYYEYDLP